MDCGATPKCVLEHTFGVDTTERHIVKIDPPAGQSTRIAREKSAVRDRRSGTMAGFRALAQRRTDAPEQHVVNGHVRPRAWRQPGTAERLRGALAVLVDADGIPVGLHDLNILEDDA